MLAFSYTSIVRSVIRGDMFLSLAFFKRRDCNDPWLVGVEGVEKSVGKWKQEKLKSVPKKHTKCNFLDLAHGQLANVVTATSEKYGLCVIVLLLLDGLKAPLDSQCKQSQVNSLRHTYYEFLTRNLYGS
jgi:hypothetical protein